MLELETRRTAWLSSGPQRLALRWGAPHLVALTLVAGGVLLSLRPPADPDVFWHVRTGDWILAHHALPRVDHWTLGADGRPWMAHAWLSEIVIALFHKAFGLKGLSLFRGLGVAVLLTMLATQAFRRTTPGRALAVTALAVFGTSGGWGERPQLLSFILLIPTAQLVRSAVAGRRSVWWVVPITYLWANLHGLWFLAPALALVGAVGAAASLPAHAGRDERVRAASPFLGAWLASVLAAGLTPNGPALLLQPLKVNGYGHFVTEWAPPSIQSPFGLAFFLVLGTLVVLYARGGARVPVYVLTQVLFAAVLGLLYVRTVAPAVVLLTPLLADAFGRLAFTARPSRFPRGFVVGAAATLAATSVAADATLLAREPDLPPAAPVAATRALLAAVPGQARVLNEYDMGGWLLLFAPSAKPAIDGRAEIYSLSYVRDYLGALRTNGDWQKVIAPLHANAALMRSEVPLVNGLRDQLGWTIVYQDDTWLVLVPPRSTS